jgi:hypothetical protein
MGFRPVPNHGNGSGAGVEVGKMDYGTGTGRTVPGAGTCLRVCPLYFDFRIAAEEHSALKCSDTEGYHDTLDMGSSPVRTGAGISGGRVGDTDENWRTAPAPFLGSETTPQGRVHGFLEGHPVPVRELPQFAFDVVVEGERRPHGGIMMLSYVAVKMAAPRLIPLFLHHPATRNEAVLSAQFDRCHTPSPNCQQTFLFKDEAPSFWEQRPATAIRGGNYGFPDLTP